MNEPLQKRFLHTLESLGLLRSDVHLLVAVSGGCDSVALLHLLKFAVSGLRLSAAHFDHAMRPDSANDARWVEGVCGAWEVPLVRGRADAPLRSEDGARRARYRFLRGAMRTVGAARLTTAHHADDQAETVLFRILRGTGTAGLRGVAPSHSSGLVRPLLPFWRSEIERYARENGLRWREDPSNRSLAPARNRIRHEILPLIERTVAPAARRNLVRLAAAARESERAWNALAAPLEQALVTHDGEDLLLARRELQNYDPVLQARLLRKLLRRFGVVLPRAGTRTALQFISERPSGRQLQLPDGIRISTEYEVVRIGRTRDLPPDEPLPIPSAPAEGESGNGTIRIGGRHYRVRWSAAVFAADRSAAFPLGALRFPLLLRGWQPGDRIRTAGGTKTLKKLFAERRVPRSRRATLPILVDADGVVLWVAGVERARVKGPPADGDMIFLAIMDD